MIMSEADLAGHLQQATLNSGADSDAIGPAAEAFKKGAAFDLTGEIDVAVL
jgi:hypothetical protein